MNALCTITTKDYMAQTLALRDSCFEHGNSIAFCILVIDSDETITPDKAGTYFFKLSDMTSEPLARHIIKKYRRNRDTLRWCLKPVFLKHLLVQEKYNKVIYADNDIYFFADFSFLFAEINPGGLLLCPHWRCTSPLVDKNWFIVNFTDGFYNAGFVGSGSGAGDALDWWMQACLFHCAKTYRKGLFDDQKYLDFIPVIFDKTTIIKHRGCNVAYWNKIENKREQIHETVKINGIWDIVFIHFTRDLIKSIMNNEDALLAPFLNEYTTACALYKNA